MVDVDHRHRQAIEEAARENLHVACQDDHVTLPGELSQELTLGLLTTILRRRNVRETNPLGDNLVLEQAVVADHADDLRVQLAAAPP